MPCTAHTAAGLHAVDPLREIEPGGEVLAVAEHDADAEVGIALELAERVDQLGHHARREAVVLLGAVEPDQVDRAALLARDAAVRVLLCHAVPPAASPGGLTTRP
jgi:orotidine-5'-phosphate decarboxylase